MVNVFAAETTGHEYEEFEEHLAELSDKTVSILAETNDVHVMSLIIDTRDACIVSGFTHMSPTQIYERVIEAKEEGCYLALYAQQGRPYQLCKVKLNFLNADLIKQVEKTKLVLCINKKVYVVGVTAIPTVIKQAEMGGAVYYDCGFAIGLAINWHIRRNVTLNFIAREVDANRLIVAVHSEKYVAIPQAALLQTYAAMDFDAKKPDAEDCCWEITQDMSKCWCDLPEIQEECIDAYELPDRIVPGIKLQSSDTGLSSVIAQCYWRFDGSNAIILGDICKSRHMGEFSPAAFATEAKTMLFNKVRSVPERLLELLKIECNNPVLTIESVFEQVRKKKEFQAFSKRRFNEIVSQLSNEFMDKRTYTAYDVAMAIFTVPDRVSGAKKNELEQLQKLSFAALFADYTLSSEPEEELLLL